MAEHNAAYFLKALKELDWSRGYTGNQLMNLFSNFPVGWFRNVPPDKTFTRWEDFWQEVTPIEASSRGVAAAEQDQERVIRKAEQRQR